MKTVLTHDHMCPANCDLAFVAACQHVAPKLLQGVHGDEVQSGP